MKSSIVKRSVVIAGHKTSVTLEDPFWSGLKEIAYDQGATMSKMVTEIDKTRQRGNLSPAIRLFVLDRVRTKLLTNPAHWHLRARLSAIGVTADIDQLLLTYFDYALSAGSAQ